MYYGNSDCSTQEDAIGTWDSDYIAVYHLNDTTDSTSNHGALENEGSDLTAGYVGNCYYLNEDYLRDQDFHDFNNETAFTISAWFNIDAANDATYKNVGIHLNDADDVGDTSGISLWHSKDAETNFSNSLINGSGNQSIVNSNPPFPFVIDEWHYVTGVGDDTDGVTIFVNGTNCSSDTTSVVFDGFSENKLYMGKHRRPVPAKFYIGYFDEVRISTVRRNDSWVVACFNTMHNATSGGFFTIGDEFGDYPLNPINVDTALYDTNLNITWTTGTYADNTLLLRKTDSYPSSRTDGTELYNGTNEYYNDSSVTQSYYYRLYSWNSTTNTFSSGVNVLWGKLLVNVYDENTSLAITNWSIFISDSDKTDTYESPCNNNTLIINVEDIPYGTNTMIKINATGYNFKVYYMDFEINTQYTLDAYLSLSNATESYIIRIINELEQPVSGAKVQVKRYINETNEYQNVTILLTDAYGYCPSVNLIPKEDYAVTITKTGYTTATYDLFPIPIIYTEDRYHTFIIEFSSEEEPIFTPQDVIDFTATINSDGNITVQYHDNRENTEDTQIRIYQYYNYTLTVNNTNNRTSDNSFTWTTTGYNISMAHKIRLWVNHSDFDDMIFMEVFLDPIRTGIVTEKTIEDRFEDVFGSWDLGYAKTFLVFLPCLMFLVVFGAMHVGLGVMSAGMYLGFTSYMINIEGVVTYATIGAILALAGFLIILVKHGERRI